MYRLQLNKQKNMPTSLFLLIPTTSTPIKISTYKPKNNHLFNLSVSSAILPRYGLSNIAALTIVSSNYYTVRPLTKNTVSLKSYSNFSRS